jgi:general secretion pathway protein J
VTQSGGAVALLFNGAASSVIFVRSAIGPNTYPHLEYVRLTEAKDDHGFSMVRTRAPFTPPSASGSVQPVVFKDPVVLVRAPFRISFSYAGGDDRVWLEEWQNQNLLPDAVRITVRDGRDRPMAASTAVRVRVTARGAPETNANANTTPPIADRKPKQ